jgi:hypothetical protein
MEEDEKLYEIETDFRMKFVIMHNLQRKRILHYHTKLLRVLKAILERLQVN